MAERDRVDPTRSSSRDYGARLDVLDGDGVHHHRQPPGRGHQHDEHHLHKHDHAAAANVHDQRRPSLSLTQHATAAPASSWPPSPAASASTHSMQPSHWPAPDQQHHHTAPPHHQQQQHYVPYAQQQQHQQPPWPQYAATPPLYQDQQRYMPPPPSTSSSDAQPLLPPPAVALPPPSALTMAPMSQHQQHYQPQLPTQLDAASRQLSPTQPQAPTLASLQQQQGPKQDVIHFLHSLDLSEYVQSFLQHGFDRMDSVFDIQEQDLEVLGVRRGHRRILQRELASLRGIPSNVPLHLIARDSLTEDEQPPQNSAGPTNVQQTNKATFYLGPDGTAPNVLHSASHTATTGPKASATTAAVAASSKITGASSSSGALAASMASNEPNVNQHVGAESTKRRYRRHPKTDPHAPVKPVSAYVAFSHTVREEMRGASFTEVAKSVGERWQGMPKEEREALEAKAAAAKEAYIDALAAYRETPEYAAHQQYLSEFKRKHAQTTLPDSPPSARTSSHRSLSASAALRPSQDQLPTPTSLTTPLSGPLPPSSKATTTRRNGVDSLFDAFEHQHRQDEADDQQSFEVTEEPITKRRRIGSSQVSIAPGTLAEETRPRGPRHASSTMTATVEPKSEDEDEQTQTELLEHSRNVDNFVDRENVHTQLPRTTVHTSSLVGDGLEDESVKSAERQAVQVLAEVVAAAASSSAAAAKAAASAAQAAQVSFDQFVGGAGTNGVNSGGTAAPGTRVAQIPFDDSATTRE
ncbi:hypothetical protein OIO90_006469 [Microbotryomycetes sp. JL221]|nr:hypothetical protein OIO90_006469 [Microbotryomycetes sp. JL221]